MAKKFIDQEDFTFEDFLAQMQQIRKLGSMKKLLMMMPRRGTDPSAAGGF